MSAAAVTTEPAREPQKQPKTLKPRSYYHVMRWYMPFLGLSSERVSGLAQERAILYIVNETLGAARDEKTPAPEWVCLTVSQIARYVGCNVRWLYSHLADAAERGLIDQVEAKDAAKHGLPKPRPQAKWYRARPENWAAAPKYKWKAAETKMPDPPEPEDEEENEPQKPAAVAKPWFRSVLAAPGNPSRAVPLPPAAKKFSVVWTGERSIRLTPQAGEDGLLILNVCEANSKKKPVTSASQVTDPDSASPPVTRTSQVAAGNPLKNQQASPASWEDLARIFSGLRPSPVLLTEEMATQLLGKLKAPLETLERCARDRHARALRNREEITSALASWVVSNANSVWAAQQKLRPAAQPEQPAPAYSGVDLANDRYILAHAAEFHESVVESARRAVSDFEGAKAGAA